MSTERDVKYPEVVVQLSGNDGNPATIIGTVSRALKRARVPESVVSEFRLEALQGDYDNVIQTAMKWVDVR